MWTDEMIQSKVIAHRRWLHQHAELSFQEYNTSNYIENYLRSLQVWEITRPTPTGVVASMKAKRQGNIIAFRADIDALPIEEKNELPFRSETPGVMHACGHDGHTAMLLTAAELLTQYKDELSGEVRLIFQHAEELPPGGAIEMVRAGVMENVTEIYGLHLSSNYPTGKIGIKSGIFTAATDKAIITVVGKGGHSAMPELCVDPVVTAAQIVLALQTIISRQISPRDTVVISVCKIEAGVNYNVIPDTATMTCSIRTFNPEVRKRLPALIQRTVEGIANSAGAEGRLDYFLGYDNVDNDAALVSYVRQLITKTFGENVVMEIETQTPGEDFSAFTRDCPGCFVELGAGNAEKGTDRPHHQSCYLMDEDALLLGTKYITALIRDRLK